MNYRIKITSFGSGRKEFKPYVKKWGLWFGLDYDGKQDLTYSYATNERHKALDCIDKHNKGNCRKTKIDFEYIEM